MYTATCTATIRLENYLEVNDFRATTPKVALADEAIRIGPPPALESYLRGDSILEAATRSGAQARRMQ